ncbi:DNA-binding XRE family transcriptional regulator [Sporohalobacter salinus]|nr:DNA-binding XRE family transcriptional regulator [Sporohalobacter salinus]
MLEISLQRYNNYEKERRRLPVEIAKKISEEFSLSLEAVFFANELFELLNFEDQKSA